MNCSTESSLNSSLWCGAYGGAARLELSDGAFGVEVDVLGTGGNATLFADADVPAAALSVVRVGSCAAVEVDETNGGGCWMYDPSACTA